MGPIDIAGIGSKDPSRHRVKIHQMVEDLESHWKLAFRVANMKGEEMYGPPYCV